MARLSASVPPPVKTISAGLAPSAAATCSRASSMAVLATRAAACWPDGFPKDPWRKGSIASSASGRSGVVAAWSRYGMARFYGRRPTGEAGEAPEFSGGRGWRRPAGGGGRRHRDAGARPAAVLTGDVFERAGDPRPQPGEDGAVPRQRRPGELPVGQDLEPFQVGVGVEPLAAPALAPQRPDTGR